MDEFLEKFNDPGEQDLFAGDQNTYQLQGSLPYLCPIFFFNCEQGFIILPFPC